MTADAVFGPLSWEEAATAAALVAIDPAGLGGVAVKALPGPVRERWTTLLRDLLPEDAPVRKVPLHIADDRLLGGLDLPATLRSGHPVAQRGVLAETDGGVVLLPMAERVETGTAAKLAAVLDVGEVRAEREGLALRSPARVGVVAFDESVGEDEPPAHGLLDRLALQIDLHDLGVRDCKGREATPAQAAEARARLASVTVDESLIEGLCGTAAAFGVASLRIPLHALNAARAAAALAGRDAVDDDDALIAVRLVIGPRATMLPPPPEEDEPEEDTPPDEPPPPEDNQDQQDDDDEDQEPPSLEDLLVAAAQAAIPPGLLAKLRDGGVLRSRGAQAGRAGALHVGKARGRPAGTRPGAPGPGARLNVIETLRTAAPWQPLRRREVERRGPSARTPRVLVRQEDFRVVRTKQRTTTTTIFAVDASGSAALHRLAEAKGAVELLLADCYVRRDRVALVAFRGHAADLLLPPTRSLVRAKRSLARLPGGGGTPMAHGIEMALDLCDSVARRGETPMIVILTDGRANVARDGTGGRARAHEDALTAARQVRIAAVGALMLDTAPRPDRRAREIAAAMEARYLPLPHCDAQSISEAIKVATP